LIGLFFQRLLQVRPSTEEVLGISGARFFTGLMPLLPPKQQPNSSDGIYYYILNPAINDLKIEKRAGKVKPMGCL